MSESRDGGQDEELNTDLSNYGDRVTPGRANQITLARVNTPTRNILKKFDNNGDGRIDANEIQTIVSTLVAEKFKSKAFKIGLIILCIFTAILLGAMFGLTWAVVAALKDTQVQGGVLVTNDKQATPILVGNMDLTVSSGLLVARNNTSVISTARVQSPGNITSQTPFEKLLALQNLVFTSPDNSSYAVAIQGIARVPKKDGTGYSIRFQTASGILTVEDGVWTISDISGSLLENLFNTADASGGRRRLLQDDDVHTYALCDSGDCGDGLPCGFDDWPSCDSGGGSSGGDDGYSDGSYSDNTNNTGATGGGCGNPSQAVTLCSAGLTSCYGYAPTATQKTNYMSQPGCLTGCKNFGWTFNGRECEGPPTLMRTFCCV